MTMAEYGTEARGVWESRTFPSHVWSHITPGYSSNAFLSWKDAVCFALVRFQVTGKKTKIYLGSYEGVNAWFVYERP